MAMTPEQAVARAIDRIGADDFGPEGWREGLERTLAAIAGLPLTEAGRADVERQIVSQLATRLQIERWYRDHPEIEAEEVPSPVLVTGMPRTGTTATVGMLGLDDRFRFPRAWELQQPVPPPIAGEEHADPRAVASREAAKAYDKPEMHIHDSDGPQEDLVFIANIAMRGFHGSLPMPDDYVDWWIAEDFTGVYAYHRRVLKLLQSRRPPNQWLLKAPPHLFKLREFAAAYPDARFVMTHRDPAKVIPSVASLHHRIYTTRCDPTRLDKARTGRTMLRLWVEAVRRSLAARAEIGEHRFIDVRNDEVVRDPIGVFERVYHHLGMAIDGALFDKVGGYAQRHAPGSAGAHRYTAEEYGLTDGEIREAFGGYIKRFLR